MSSKRKASKPPSKSPSKRDMPRQNTTTTTTTTTTSNFLALAKGSKTTIDHNTVDQTLLNKWPAGSKDDYWSRILDYKGRRLSDTINSGAVPFFYSSLPRPDRKSGSTPSSSKSEQKSATPSNNKSQKSKKRSHVSAAPVNADCSPKKRGRGRPRKEDRPVSAARSHVSAHEDDIADFLAVVGTTPTAGNSEREGGSGSNSGAAVASSAANAVPSGRGDGDRAAAAAAAGNGSAGVMGGSGDDGGGIRSGGGGDDDVRGGAATASWSSAANSNREHTVDLSFSPANANPSKSHATPAAATAASSSGNVKSESTNMEFKKFFRFKLSSHQLKELEVSPLDHTVHKLVKKPRNPLHIGDTIVSINGQRMESVDNETREAWLSGQLMPSHPMELETYGQRSLTAPLTFVIGGKRFDTAVLLRAVEDSVEISEDSKREAIEAGHQQISVDDDEGSVWLMVQMAVLGIESTPSELIILQETYEQYFGHVVMPRGK